MASGMYDLAFRQFLLYRSTPSTYTSAALSFSEKPYLFIPGKSLSPSSSRSSALCLLMPS